MPALQPLVLEMPDDTVTFNPIGLDNNRATFTDSSPVSISMKQRLTVKVRPAAINNNGHVVESILVQPLAVETPNGCCPTTGAPPVSSFNLRFTRGTLSSDEEVKKLREELIAFVQSDDFEALTNGSAYY